MSEFVFPIARSLLSPTSRVEEPSPSPASCEGFGFRAEASACDANAAARSISNQRYRCSAPYRRLLREDWAESSANGRSRVDGGRLLQHGQYHLPGTDEDRRIKLLETSSTANIMTTTARTATEAAASVGLT